MGCSVSAYYDSEKGLAKLKEKAAYEDRLRYKKLKEDLEFLKFYKDTDYNE